MKRMSDEILIAGSQSGPSASPTRSVPSSCPDQDVRSELCKCSSRVKLKAAAIVEGLQRIHRTAQITVWRKITSHGCPRLAVPSCDMSGTLGSGCGAEVSTDHQFGQVVSEVMHFQRAHQTVHT